MARGWPKGKPRGPKPSVTLTPANGESRELPSREISGSGVVGTRNADRLAMFDAIGDKVADALDAEEGRPPEEPAEAPVEPVETPVEEVEAEPAPAEEVESDPAPAAVQAPPELVTIKVNGKERQVTHAELVALAQKNEAADDHLREAKDILARVKQVAAPVAHQQPPVEEDDRALVRAIQMGSEEEAVQAIRKLKAPAPTMAPVAQLVDERLAFRSSMEQFAKDYPEIAGNKTLFQWFISENSKLVESGDRRSFTERHTAVGNELREAIKSASASTQTLTDEKLRRKATVTPITAASARSAPVVDQEPSDDPREIIAEMAKARGQLR